ncbi:MAG: TonB-dependent receptor, partial [Pseudarcicella sp.]|nr:TonB-dependent receptor [Pseudarcicella sp.]
ERIEVLRDGAAAQYGSDAIAGVINLVLKKSTDLEVTLNYGQNFSHEQRGYKAGESLNGTNTDASLLASGFYQDWTNNTSDKWHYDGQSFIGGISKGFNIGKGFVNASFQYWRQGKSNRAGLDPNYQYFGKTKVGQKDVFVTPALLKTDTVSLNPKEATFDRENWWFGKSELDDYSGFLNASFPLSKTTELYAFGGYSRRNGSGPCFWRRPNVDNNVRSINPDGYLPNVRPVNIDFSAAGGVKFKLANWKGDASINYGHNNFNFKGITQNVSLGDVADIADPALKARTSFDGGGTKFSQLSGNLDLSKEFQIGLATPLNLAGGFEYRTETYEIYAGERASYENGLQKIQDGPNEGKVAPVGCQCVQAFHKLDATSKSRQNTAVFFDAEADLIKNLSFGLAARLENYTDFGSTFNWKASARYEIQKGLAIRGAISTGFRAPALQQQFYSNRSLQATSSGDLSQTGTFPVETPIAKILGAKPLKAEKSNNYSLGLTFNRKNFSISVDAYKIDLVDRIILSEQFEQGKEKLSLPRYLDTLAGNNKDFLGIQKLNYFTNGLNTSTKGIDITGSYNFIFSSKQNLKVTLSANFTKTKITNEAEIGTPAELSKYSSTPLLGHTNQVSMEYGTPRSVVNVIFNYNYKNFGITYRPTYFGKIIASERFGGNNPLNDQTYKGTLIHNLEISESLVNKTLRLALGANNLWDTYPEKRFKSMSLAGILPYSGYVPYGFTGRYVYLRVQYNLKK